MVVNYISISAHIHIHVVMHFQQWKNILCSIATVSLFSKIRSGDISSVSSPCKWLMWEGNFGNYIAM